jgi:hypothetical protein
MAAEATGVGPGALVVDVGGGRGDHAAVFRSVGATAVVVDRSPEMARFSKGSGIPAVVGLGERLPISTDSASLVYFHLSIHHGDAAAMLREATRVIAPTSSVWVWTLAPGHHRSSNLARWFPSVATIDEARMPHPDWMAAELVSHGCVIAEPVTALEHVERTAGSWVEAVRAGFVSTLHLVDPTEIEQGLDAFTAEHPDPNEIITYEISYVGVHATHG